MQRDHMAIRGLTIPLVTTRVAVVGSGAAALSAAVNLKRLGVDDLLIVTERLGGGTSANAGSDKQTYYRLNPGAPEGDSVQAMAETLCAGGCMHGDIALIEAGISPLCFARLVDVGVPFPHDRFGCYVGFKTDHDPRARGTSAGPRTSIEMYARLLDEARSRAIPILDTHRVIRLLTDGAGETKRVIGLIALDTSAPPTLPRAVPGENAAGMIVIKADYVVYGPGGPGELYADSVYPPGQTGALGVALRAGAVAHNLTESQFGIAARHPRWNLSGSYQQVLPCYLSTAPDGSDAREFLNAAFPSAEALITAQFLKGYQWPFDVRRIADYGSSTIDLLVFHETTAKRRRVFLDFTRNPSYPGYNFDPATLPEPARDYLERSQALAPTPVARLKAMNAPAYELFRSHGIDLEHERLEIIVANQHLNGGLVGSIWWESNLANFFPVGEVCGTHGIYRPGGSALNAGQAGAWRAAECIAWRSRRDPECDRERTIECMRPQIEHALADLDGLLTSPGSIDPDADRRRIQERMSRTMGIVREPAAIGQAIAANAAMQATLAGSGLHDPGTLGTHLQNMDLLLTERVFLESAKVLIKRLHQTVTSDAMHTGRGSFIEGRLEDIVRAGDTGVSIAACQPDASLNNRILEVWYDEAGEVHTRWTDVRPLPVTDDWFETVWAAFRNGSYFQEGS